MAVDYEHVLSPRWKWYMRVEYGRHQVMMNVAICGYMAIDAYLMSVIIT